MLGRIFEIIDWEQSNCVLHVCSEKLCVARVV